MTEHNGGMSRGKKIVVAFIIVFLLLTAAAYLVGVYYFSNHFLPGSRVNGFNCSYMTPKETENLLTKQAEAYVLAIRTRGNGQESISAGQAGLAYTPDGSVKKLMQEQDRFLWFLGFSQSTEYELTAANTYDEELLTQSIRLLNCMQEQNNTAPADAYIKETESGFEIAPEVEGTQLKKEQVQKLIVEAVTSGKTVLDLEEEDCYEKPSVYRDDAGLIKDCEQVNKLTDVVITYDFADRTETVDRDVIKNWLVKDEKGDYTLDREQAAAYVNDLGYKYDTFGCTRNFRTYDGREITITGGDYGWAIDQTAETDALIDAIRSGKTQVREPVYAYEGWSRDSNDIGYTYVEIDLTNQRMVFYKDGVPVVDTDVVTGSPNVEGMETPTGCFAIDAMKSPSVLTGEGYAAEVTYWMPFCGNVGIHDAAWRSDFGGSVYVFDGSHGCVNTPYDQAAIIYQNIGIGAPVVVYK